jgi:hypothetical protein
MRRLNVILVLTDDQVRRAERLEAVAVLRRDSSDSEDQALRAFLNMNREMTTR